MIRAARMACPVVAGVTAEVARLTGRECGRRPFGVITDTVETVIHPVPYWIIFQ